MKPGILFFKPTMGAIALLALAFSSARCVAATAASTNGIDTRAVDRRLAGVLKTPSKVNVSTVGDRLVQLLEHRDVERFANDVAPSAQDWRSLRPTNTSAAAGADKEFNDLLKNRVDHERKMVTDSARRLLETANRLGLEQSRFRFRLKELPPKVPGNAHFPLTPTESYDVPWMDQMQFVLIAEPVGNTAEVKKLAGEYGIALAGLIELPTGWRVYGAVRWSQFPPGVADKQTELETQILSKTSKYEPLLETDDPALAKLGDAVIRLFQQREEKAFAADAIRTADEILKDLEKQSRNPADMAAMRSAFQKQYDAFQEQLLSSVRTCLGMATNLGINFSAAKIELRRAAAQNIQSRGSAGSVDGLVGGPVQLTLSVRSDEKSRNGQSVSGDYVLTINRVARNAGRWTMEDKMRWEKFPDGLLDEKTQADLAFENYVAEHRALPPGTMAPDIEFIRMDNEAKGKLSDYRGKVVILEFWATWCGPCQEPMAKLQTYSALHPEWKDKVEMIALSIDDTLAKPREHVAKRGWTNTFNVWAGDGAFSSGAPNQFRVTGIPTLYIIDREGKIVRGGHPAGMDLGPNVQALLK